MQTHAAQASTAAPAGPGEPDRARAGIQLVEVGFALRDEARQRGTARQLGRDDLGRAAR